VDLLVLTIGSFSGFITNTFDICLSSCKYKAIVDLGSVVLALIAV
jgi:hypothetical protein